MKCVILAGGLGSRISEETYLKPKPMIQIGGKPILWHIMKNILRLWRAGFHYLRGFQGLHHQGVFRQLLSPYVRRDIRYGKEQHAGPPKKRGAMEGHDH